jgi:periplasmic copper chaperone A
MKKLLAVCLLALLTAPATAHEIKFGDLEIVHPWARATAGASKTGAVYMRIENNGNTDDQLIGMATDSAERVEMHASTEENGVASMQKVDAIDLPAHSTIKFKPGEYHVMLIGVDPPLREYDTFKMTLVFAKTGRVEVEVYVEEAGAMEPDHQ